MSPADILSDRLENIIGHLGAAIVQSIPSDDQIIMSHVRNAYAIAKAIRDEPYALSPTDLKPSKGTQLEGVASIK